ncbi:hypothetical protein KKC22_20545 [Myxococcota bacterium]|nr:hypothetical protein [Myxococcota bacterium]
MFEVQAWIADGRPVDPPVHKGGRRTKNPLEVAIAQGSHSLVLVLLKGGATISDNSYNALEQALAECRVDLIRLLVEYGADLASVDMVSVFDSWDPEIMEYCIEQGGDVETDSPLAVALCDRVRTALGVFKRHQDQFPSFQEQLNTALRFHCREGDLKWVSLLLWAGADPFAKGVGAPGEEPEPDPDDELCALEYAALYDHLEICKLKKIKIAPDHPIAYELVR